MISTGAKYNFILSSWGLQYLRPHLFRSLEYVQGDKIKDSILGTPVFDNVIFADNLENPTMQIEIDTILIDAELTKLIQKTSVTGRNGRVKEYIADDDWRITFRGAIFSQVKDAYPADDVRILKNLCRVQSQLEVSSIFLNELLGIDSIVVERFSLNQRSGKMNAQAFQITASSDLPYELIQEVDNA